MIGLNCFLLLNFLEQEFTQYYLNERLSYANHHAPSSLSSKDPLKVTPEAFDWRNLSAVTDVKNQVRENQMETDLQRPMIFL